MMPEIRFNSILLILSVLHKVMLNLNHITMFFNTSSIRNGQFTLLSARLAKGEFKFSNKENDSGLKYNTHFGHLLSSVLAHETQTQTACLWLIYSP